MNIDKDGKDETHYGVVWMIRKDEPRNPKEAQWLRGIYTVMGNEEYMWCSRMTSGMMIGRLEMDSRIADKIGECHVVRVRLPAELLKKKE